MKGLEEGGPAYDDLEVSWRAFEMTQEEWVAKYPKLAVSRWLPVVDESEVRVMRAYRAMKEKKQEKKKTPVAGVLEVEVAVAGERPGTGVESVSEVERLVGGDRLITPVVESTATATATAMGEGFVDEPPLFLSSPEPEPSKAVPGDSGNGSPKKRGRGTVEVESEAGEVAGTQGQAKKRVRVVREKEKEKKAGKGKGRAPGERPKSVSVVRVVCEKDKCLSLFYRSCLLGREVTRGTRRSTGFCGLWTMSASIVRVCRCRTRTGICARRQRLLTRRTTEVSGRVFRALLAARRVVGARYAGWMRLTGRDPCDWSKTRTAS